MVHRTRNETLDFMLAELNAGRLGAVKDGSCVYESDTGTHCIVGCLFTPEQHANIKARGLNNYSIEFLISAGVQIDAGGLTPEEIDTLQSAHDLWAHSAETSQHVAGERKCNLVKTISDLKLVE